MIVAVQHWCIDSWERLAISDILFVILIVVSGIAVGCIQRAGSNLAREKEALQIAKKRINDLCKRFSNKELRDSEGINITEPYDALVRDAELRTGICLDSSAAVQHYLEADKREHLLHSGYVSDRLYAIICSVSTQNMVRKLPPLQDLHELTMQRERGGRAVSIFRFLSPSILVLGILGTLLGVHENLSSISGESGIAALANALQPGAFAVGCTVLVMALRGIYNKDLSRFVSEFNDYTLTCLLPFFRPISQSQADVDKLKIVLDKAVNSYERLQGLWQSISAYKKGVSFYESGCVAILTHLCQNMELLSSTLETCRDIFTDEQQWQKKAAVHVVNITQAYHQLGACLTSWSQSALAAENTVATLHGQICLPMLNTTRNWLEIHKLVANLNTCNQKLSAIVQQSFGMPDLAAHRERLQEVLNWLRELEEKMMRYSGYVDTIAKSDENIDRNIDIVKGMIDGLQIPETGGVPQLKHSYDKVRAEAAPLQDAFCGSNETVVKSLRHHMNSLQLLERKYRDFNKYYPSGWVGYKMRCKFYIMSLRENRKFRMGVWLTFATMVLWLAGLCIVPVL